MYIEALFRTKHFGCNSVSVPELPGCYSEGETLSKALHNIEEVAQLWLEVTAEIQEEEGNT